MNLKGILGGGRDLSKMDGINNVSQPTRDITTMPEGNDGKVYYYVGAIYNGQPVVLGRYYSWEQASQEGKKKLPIPFEIFPLTTGDMRLATKKVKYALLSNNNVDVVMNRAKHIIEPDDDSEVEEAE